MVNNEIERYGKEVFEPSRGQSVEGDLFMEESEQERIEGIDIPPEALINPPDWDDLARRGIQYRMR